MKRPLRYLDDNAAFSQSHNSTGLRGALCVLLYARETGDYGLCIVDRSCS